MKDVVMLHIDFDDRDLRDYHAVTLNVIDHDGATRTHKEFTTGNPCRDWRDAIVEAVHYGLPVLRDTTCEAFVNGNPDYRWGSSGKKLIIEPSVS